MPPIVVNDCMGIASRWSQIVDAANALRMKRARGILMHMKQCLTLASAIALLVGCGTTTEVKVNITQELQQIPPDVATRYLASMTVENTQAGTANVNFKCHYNGRGIAGFYRPESSLDKWRVEMAAVWVGESKSKLIVALKKDDPYDYCHALNETASSGDFMEHEAKVTKVVEALYSLGVDVSEAIKAESIASNRSEEYSSKQ